MENQLILALKGNKLLKNIDINALNLNAIKGKLQTISEGQILFREGDNSDSIYLLISGEINLLHKKPNTTARSIIVIENEFFGQDEFIEGIKRTSTAVALRDSYLIGFVKSEIDNLIEQNDEILKNIYASIDVDDASVDTSREDEIEIPAINFFSTSKSKISETRTEPAEIEESPEASSPHEFTVPANIDGMEFDVEKNLELEDIDPLQRTLEHNHDDLLNSFVDEKEETENHINITDEDFFDFSKAYTLTPDKDKKTTFVGNEFSFPDEIDTSKKQPPSPKAKEDKSPSEIDSTAPKETVQPDVASELDAFMNSLSGSTTEIDEYLKNELAELMAQEGGDISQEKLENIVTPEISEFLKKELSELVTQSRDDITEEKHDDIATPEMNEYLKEELSDLSPQPADEIPQEPIEEASIQETSPIDLANTDFESFYANFKVENGAASVSNEDEISIEKPVEAEEDLQVSEVKDLKVSEDENLNLEMEDEIVPERKKEINIKEEVSKIKRDIAERENADEIEISPSHYLSQEQFNRVNKAAQIVNSNIKIDEVLQNIVEAARELTSADRGTLYLVSKEKPELWSKVAMGSESREIKLKIGEGLAGVTAQTGELINIVDVKVDKRFNRAYDKLSGYETKCMLCFPIKDKNEEVIGVLQLLNSLFGEFSSFDEDLLKLLSTHAALALQNAELVEQLLSSERQSSLGKMTNFLINDIKKPILVSKRYAEHLKTKELSEDLTKVVNMMLEQLNHIADLVQSTSMYSESEVVLRSIVKNINSVLDDSISRADSMVRTRNCKIIKEYDVDVNVKISEKQFYQCFSHIIKNACDAMQEGGNILLTTKKADNKIYIHFKDTGIGIPESLLAKIFEPFMSHGKKDATGLGLSITKKIIEEHGGTITAASDLGEGTTITVSLPISISV
ncbi:MAG: ATP-binding protein [Bacteroidota bacterium]